MKTKLVTLATLVLIVAGGVFLASRKHSTPVAPEGAIQIDKSPKSLGVPKEKPVLPRISYKTTSKM